MNSAMLLACLSKSKCSSQLHYIMFGQHTSMGFPYRKLRLLLCMMTALILALCSLTVIDVSKRARWIFEKPFYKSRRTLPTTMRESANEAEQDGIFAQRAIAIVQSQSPLKTESPVRWAAAGPDVVTAASDVATTTTESLTFPSLRSPEMYVRSGHMGMGKLGNRMFEYISSYVTAKRLGLQFVVTTNGRQLQAYQQMSSLFSISAPLYSGNFSVDRSIREQGWGIYTASVTKIESYGSYTKIIGYLQSWRYFSGFEKFVRKEFALTYNYRLFVNEFFAKNGIRLISGDQKSATLIAVHVRRGDMLLRPSKFQMASPQYLEQAIVYFRSKYAAQQPIFIVATDDKPWTRAILDSALQNGSAPVIYANGTAEEDMAVLSSCHHAIITGGTYGWWAAWLTGGNVMYFRDFIWNGSIAWSEYNAEDYYPPYWIGRS